MIRQEAKAQGLKRYFTGKPCKYGHTSERFVSNKSCCQCKAEREQTPEYKAQSAIQKAEYRQANRAKIAAYHQANREKIAVKKAAYGQANREKIAAKNVAYNQANREKIAAKRAANSEKLAAKQAAYAKANRHIINALCAKRNAQKLQATPPWVDYEAIKAIYGQAAFITRITGESNHVDHIIPLQGKTVCGLHVHTNLQILTATDNIKKSNKLLPTYETLETAVE